MTFVERRGLHGSPLALMSAEVVSQGDPGHSMLIEGDQLITQPPTYKLHKVTGGERGNLEPLSLAVLPAYKTYHRDELNAGSELQKYIRPGMFVETVEKDGEVVAFDSFSVKDVISNSHGVTIWANIECRVVHPDYWGQGIGTRLSRDLIELFRPNFITGESAHPGVFVANEKTGYIVRGYPRREKRGHYDTKMLNILREAIGWEKFRRIDDYEVGLCQDNYEPGKRVIAEIDPIRHRRGYELLNEWEELGLNRANGDEIRYVQEAALSLVPLGRKLPAGWQ